MSTGFPRPLLPRSHALDALRAVAMLLGVYLHAAFAYAEGSQTVWLATDSKSSVIVDVSIWLIHLFRMSLFFALSGYLSRLMFERRGLAGFLKQRLLRLAVPFALFYPFLLAAMTLVIVFSLGYQASPRGLMGLIARGIADNNHVPQQQPWSTMHLWFLYYLMMFSLLAAALTRCRYMSFDSLFKPRILCFLFPLALMPGAMLAGTPLPAPESFVPQLWPFLFYGLYYFWGWQMAGREEWLTWLQAYLWPITATSVVLFAIYYGMMPDLDLDMLAAGTMPPMSWQRSIMLGALTAYLSASLSLLALLWGKRLYHHPSGQLRFMADASYWVYLIHLPIVLFIQTMLAPLDWPLWLKLFVVLSVTMLFCMASYIAFVRYTPLGWLLHGKRTFP